MDSSAIALCSTAIGMVSCMTFATMNFVLDQIAIPAMLVQHQRMHHPWTSFQTGGSKKEDPKPTSLVLILRQWSVIQYLGHFVGPTSAVLSTVAFSTASFFVASSSTRALLRLAAGCAFAVMPFTVLFILKANDELNVRAGQTLPSQVREMKEGNDKAAEATGSTMEEDLVKLRRWVRLNDVRASLATVALVLGFSAFLRMV